MDWTAIFGLIDPALLIVVAGCWVLGYILKQTPVVQDWGIVYIVSVCSIIAVGIMESWTVQSIIQGLLCGAFAVYGNQLVKQAKKGNDDES